MFRHAKWLSIFLHVVSALCQFLASEGLAYKFDRNYTGVTFNAYVRSVGPKTYDFDNYDNREWLKYTKEDVKTMLKVISGKFSKVATFGVGSRRNVRYQENVTYNGYSYSEVYSAEAAAMLNAEEKRPLLSMLIGVWIFKEQQMNTEFELALESAKIANTLYPGTVWGLVFGNNAVLNANMFSTLVEIDIREWQEMKKRTKKSQLKFGARLNCHLELQLMTEILKLSDFIICVIQGSHYNFESRGPDVAFSQVTVDLVQFREELKKINPSIEVMGQTGFSTWGRPETTLESLKYYWEKVDKWASENQFHMWMFEAIDNPWKTIPNVDEWGAHYGWWKLKRDEEVGQMEGYVEKISMLQREEQENRPSTPHPSDKHVSTWTYVGVAVGILVAIGIFGHLILQYVRFTKLRNSVLTKEEVEQFVQGGRVAGNGENGSIESSALAKPYDASFEISKDNLIIVWEGILGVGEFGCVYRAFVTSPNEENVEVALKMAKSGCPKSAVKSILTEIKILLHLGAHPNIVGIKGAYTAEIHRGVVYVATEFCQVGSLKVYLRETKRISSRISNSYEDLEVNFINSLEDDNSNDLDKPELQKKQEDGISFADMVRWSYEISCGMEYLGLKHVVHADLAARNVLLMSDKTAKITDFGLSRRLYDYTNYVKKQQEPMPWRWMSIQALKNLEFSCQSDVWSFGVTLWEIFSMGDLPYPGLTWSTNFLTCLERGLRMQSPRYASRKIFDIMMACWAEKPQNRPTFTTLKSELCSIMKNCWK